MNRIDYYLIENLIYFEIERNGSIVYYWSTMFPLDKNDAIGSIPAGYVMEMGDEIFEDKDYYDFIFDYELLNLADKVYEVYDYSGKRLYSEQSNYFLEKRDALRNAEQIIDDYIKRNEEDWHVVVIETDFTGKERELLNKTG